MAFDINQHVVDEDEEAELAYLNEIMSRFSTSAEGQEVLAASGDIGWAYTFMEYGMDYLGITPPEMSPVEIEKLLFDIFPRKVSALPGAGEEIIAELRAFWAFLQREFQLTNAEACLRMLQATKGRTLEKELQDPANFGMAKSFVMLGRASGFDMTTEEGLQAFTEVYNAGLQGKELPLPPIPPIPPELFSPFTLFDEPDDPHPKRRLPKKTVTRRKMAQISRRKNRKK